MRKLNVFFLLVAVSFFALTSCQKDQAVAVSTETEIANETNNAPISSAQKVEGEIKTFATEITDKLIEDQPEVIFDNTMAISRNGEDEIEILGVSASTKVKIECGDSHRSSNDHYNNSFTDAFYASRGYRSNLNGGDNVFYFDAHSDMQVSFSLSTFSYNRENLAMFLFEGDYDDFNHRAIVRQVVAASSSSSRYREELSNVSLRRGRRYILVVDSAPGRGADYELTVNCPTTGGGCDDFDHYYNGNITPQAYNWEKWDFNSKDGEIQGGYNKYLYMARDPYSGQHSQPDVIYKTGRVNSGVQTLSMDIWVYTGYSGYFNIQKRLRQEYGAELYFHDRGVGELKIANRAYNFSYPQNRWASVEMEFDFYSDRVTLRIDGRQIRTWSTRYSSNTAYGSNQIEGVDFYTPKNDSEFWIDNLCFR